VIRILLVDDQELIRAGLRGILRPRFGFEVVGECSDGREVPAAVARLRPDIVLMDIRMPAVDGVAATAAVRGQQGAPPVLMLTTFDDDEALAGALRAGASGFLLKGVQVEDLQRAVATVAGGGAWLDPAVTGRVLSTYRAGPPGGAPAPPEDGPPGAGGPGAAVDPLTARERQVLALIGQGMTNGEIAADLVLGEGTVKTHVNHIFAKLALRDRAAAIVFAFDHGLVRPSPARPPTTPPTRPAP
jgi:DNA-binding NarL/FixJ family response regulator